MKPDDGVNPFPDVLPPFALEIRDLSLELPNGRLLFAELQLQLGVGESIAVMGPSGSGKSSLLSVCLGLQRPTAGEVAIMGTSLRGLGQRQLAATRAAHVGVVFQSGELLPELTATENVALPALLARRPADEAFAAARSALQRVGLVGDLAAVPELSGGEQLRVAVARAVVNRPSLILADEPTGSLDPDSRELVIRQLFDLPRAGDCALLVVTHDREVAARAQRTVRLGERGLVPV